MDVECFVGTMNVFLSPKQLHLLLELCSGFSSPGKLQKSKQAHICNKQTDIQEDKNKFEVICRQINTVM